MSEDQLREALRKAAPGKFSEAELAKMSREQLEAEVKKAAGRISEDDLKKMSADEMREALRARAGGQFTEEELRKMSRGELEEELRKRGAGKTGYSAEELQSMSPADLREALRQMAPGQFTEEQLLAMTPDQLRDELTRQGKSGEELRAALRSAAPGVFSDDQLARMTDEEMRDELRKRAAMAAGGAGAAALLGQEQLRCLGTGFWRVVGPEERLRLEPCALTITNTASRGNRTRKLCDKAACRVWERGGYSCQARALPVDGSAGRICCI